MSAWANFRAGLQDRLDGLGLFGLGGLMVALARSTVYWDFLNPKFRPLTLTAGVLLLVAGLPLFLRPRPGRATLGRLLRQAALLVFLTLAAIAWDQAVRESAPDTFGGPPGVANPAQQEDAALPQGEEAPVDLHPVKNGTTYVRLNLAELFIMLDKGRKDYPQHFALRAEVQRAPALETRGYLLLRRIAVVCCLADSLDLRFLTHAPEGGWPEDLKDLKDGDWVEVFGRVEPIANKGADKGLVKLAPKGEGPGLAVTNAKFRIQVESLERLKDGAFPYLFEFREKEPFAW
jgi:hypothetical protein